MRDLPLNGAVVVWTPSGPKIMNTDAQGDMVDFKRTKAGLPAGSRVLPHMILGARPAPKGLA